MKSISTSIKFLFLFLFLYYNENQASKVNKISRENLLSLPNIALSDSGANATAISEGTYLGIKHYASWANDGDSNTIWASQWDMPAWLEIEFRKIYYIKQVGVWWSSHQHKFSIELSLDGNKWTTVVSTRLSNNSEGSAPIHEIFSIVPTNAKFIRINIETTSAPTSHIFQAAVGELEAYADISTESNWIEGFESYTAGTFPSTWTPDGNAATNNAENFVDSSVSYSGKNSLKLFGAINSCWGALAYRPLGISPPFYVEVKVRNGNETLGGCHPSRAGIALRQGTRWQNPSRAFVDFKNDGTIESGGKNVNLGTYSSLTWMSLKIGYERVSKSEVRLSYWINGKYKGNETLAASNYEDQFTNFQVSVNEGSAWFDDISIVKYNIKDTIKIKIPNIKSYNNDTVLVPINIELPTGKKYDSAEFTFKGYSSGLTFIGIDTTSSMIAKGKWMFTYNGNTKLLSVFSGANDISGMGKFCDLKFVVNGVPCSFIPIQIDSVLFNTGEDTVVVSNGGVQILPNPIYGDIDNNGKIQAHDASLILKYLVGYDTLSCQSISNADVTLDGSISALDASIIQKYLVKKIDRLPYDTTMGNLQATGKIIMEDQVINYDKLLKMPLILKDGNNILSFSGKLIYDPNILTFEYINWSDSLSNFLINTNASNGQILFAGSSTNADGHSYVFAQVIFKIKNPNVKSTKIRLKNFRFNEGAILKDSTSANVLLGVDKNEKFPKDYTILQNYPNPFNPSTKFQYQIPERSLVTIKIYDIMGKVIKTLVNKVEEAGSYEKVFNAEFLSSGLYFYQFVAKSLISNILFRKTKKMILLK